MNITKYTHACLVLEKAGTRIVIDPGSFSSDFDGADDVAAVVVTHAHADHFDEHKLRSLKARNPSMKLYAPQEVVDAAGSELEIEAVTGGQTLTVEGFTLEFTGEDHALIHTDLPSSGKNVGVLVDDTLYYPGDSFTHPPRAVTYLALPVSGPWMKIGEAIDFMVEVGAPHVFATHDAINSDAAQSMIDTMVAGIASQHDIDYRRLEIGIDTPLS